MCWSLEHQNPSKTSEKMGYFDRVTISLDLRLLIFKMGNNKVDVGQVGSEEIVYGRFIKIPLG